MTETNTLAAEPVAAPPPEAGQQLTHRQIVTVLVGLMLGMFVAALSQTVVATALPTIVGDLGGQDQLSWVVSAALLASTASTPLWGKLSDLYGRKLLFQIAICVFLAGSVLAGLSQNMGELIGFRGLQGLGMGGLMALSQAIIGDIVPPRERGRYQGYIGSVFAVSSVAGPLIGGFLVDSLSWRWTFYVGVPIGFAALIVTNRVLRVEFTRHKHKVDYLGAALIFAGVSALLLVASLGGKEFDWASTQTAILSGLGVVLLLGAVLQERRAAEPILPPRLFRDRVFNVAGVVGFVVGVAMFGAIIYLPQYLQIVKGHTPTVSGLMSIPMMVGVMTTSIGSGRIITRTGRYKAFPVIGMVILAGGLFLFSLLDADTGYPQTAGSMLVLGCGMGMTMQVLILAVQNSVSHRDMGVATSAATFFRSMGGAVGVAIFGAVLSNRLGTNIQDLMVERRVRPPRRELGELLGTPEQIHHLPRPLREVIVDGFAMSLQTTFRVAIPIALLGFLLVLLLPERSLRATTGRGAGAAATPEEELSVTFETSFDTAETSVPDLTDGDRPNGHRPPDGAAPTSGPGAVPVAGNGSGNGSAPPRPQELLSCVRVRELGHLVLYVRDIERSRRFYADVLGWHELTGDAPAGTPAAAFSSGRTHHELLLIQVGPHAAPIPDGPRVGMYHFGVNVGETDDDLRAVVTHLITHDVPILGASDHTVTHSIYVADPDGNEIELYVDAISSDCWRANPSLLFSPIRPLDL
ncbi:MAG TPA: DHA2 family efflux MFS transporter permease subunit [Acidimicrobiales bacterium]|nr:DHA2 family efflux MFS transporter permease subunit [Acidimicrobiales bacterium]